MSEHFIRCAHCGLPHDAHIAVCPTTGLRIDTTNRPKRRKARKAGDRSAEQERMVGRIIDDKYRIVGAVGEGGMSSIYQAEQRGLDRPLKNIPAFFEGRS